MDSEKYLMSNIEFFLQKSYILPYLNRQSVRQYIGACVLSVRVLVLVDFLMLYALATNLEYWLCTK